MSQLVIAHEPTSAHKLLVWVRQVIAKPYPRVPRRIRLARPATDYLDEICLYPNTADISKELVTAICGLWFKMDVMARCLPHLSLEPRFSNLMSALRSAHSYFQHRWTDRDLVFKEFLDKLKRNKKKSESTIG